MRQNSLSRLSPRRFDLRRQLLCSFESPFHLLRHLVSWEIQHVGEDLALKSGFGAWQLNPNSTKSSWRLDNRNFSSRVPFQIFGQLDSSSESIYWSANLGDDQHLESATGASHLLPRCSPVQLRCRNGCSPGTSKWCSAAVAEVYFNVEWPPKVAEASKIPTVQSNSDQFSILSLGNAKSWKIWVTLGWIPQS